MSFPVDQQQVLQRKVYALPLVFGVVLCFEAACTYLDLARPHLNTKKAYVVALGLCSLLIGVGFILKPYLARKGAVTPPDQRIAEVGPDPLLTLRAFAFLLVFLGHYFAVVFPPETLAEAIRDHPMYWLATSSPWAGVWIFFTLSAYLMGKGFFTQRYGFDASNIARFYWHRAVRIYPVYIAAIVLVLVFRSPEMLSWRNGPNLLRTLALAGAEPQVTKPIGALWSISTEFQFYLLAPFMAAAVHRLSSTKLLAAILGGVLFFSSIARYVAMWRFELVWPFTIYPPFIWNIDFFIAGMVLARIVHLLSAGAWSLRLRRGAMLACFVPFYIFLSYAGSRSAYLSTHWTAYMSFMPLLSSAFACCAIFVFEGTQGSMSRATGLVVRSTQLLGILTYCLYVWHEPVLLAFRSTLGTTINLQSTFRTIVPVIVSCLIVAYGSYWLVERPFERAGRR